MFFYFRKPKSLIKLKNMFFFKNLDLTKNMLFWGAVFFKKTRPPKKACFLLNQGSAACVGLAAQFYHRSRRQRPTDDQSVVLCNALLCALSYDKS